MRPILGVYGPNPRDRASESMGRTQIDACAALLAERVTALLAGGDIDTMADLRDFVERYWPEPLTLAGRAGPAGSATLLITNPAPVSRYLTSLALTVDGQPMAAEGLRLVNETPGEVGVEARAEELGPEHGSYVRRLQSASVRLPADIDIGPHEVVLDVGLAGVASRTIDETIVFA